MVENGDVVKIGVFLSDVIIGPLEGEIKNRLVAGDDMVGWM